MPNKLQIYVDGNRAAMLDSTGAPTWIPVSEIEQSIANGFVPDQNMVGGAKQNIQERDEAKSKIDAMNQSLGGTDAWDNVMAGLAATGRGVTFGGSDWLLTKSGAVEASTLRNLQNDYPATSLGFEVGGSVASLLLPTSWVGALAKGAASATSLAKAAITGTKIAKTAQAGASVVNAAKATSTVTRVAKIVGQGSAIGATTALGQSALAEKDFIETAESILQGATTGAVTSAAFGTMAAGIGKVGKMIGSRVSQAAEKNSTNLRAWNKLRNQAMSSLRRAEQTGVPEEVFAASSQLNRIDSKIRQTRSKLLAPYIAHVARQGLIDSAVVGGITAGAAAGGGVGHMVAGSVAGKVVREGIKKYFHRGMRPAFMGIKNESLTRPIKTAASTAGTLSTYIPVIFTASDYNDIRDELAGIDAQELRETVGMATNDDTTTQAVMAQLEPTINYINKQIIPASKFPGTGEPALSAMELQRRGEKIATAVDRSRPLKALLSGLLNEDHIEAAEAVYADELNAQRAEVAAELDESIASGRQYSYYEMDQLSLFLGMPNIKPDFLDSGVLKSAPKQQQNNTQRPNQQGRAHRVQSDYLGELKP